MKKIVMIFAAMAAVLPSCQKSELESVSVNDCKDIVLNIIVSNPGADDTKALIKEGWEENDQIKIWFDARTGETPDLVIKYDKTNNKWTQDGDAAFVPTSASGKVKAVFSNNVIVASVDEYTLSGNTLTFSIAHWVFLTEIQVVVYGDDIDGTYPAKYTLACDKFSPLAAGIGYTVGSDAITASVGDKGTAVTGINNTDGVAFVFATADYSATAAAYKFTLTDNTVSPAVTKEYTATTDKISGTSGSMAAIKALTIASTKFAVPTTGTAKATIGGIEVDVNWVQLWENGPKFAEYNVGASSATDRGTMMSFAEATAENYTWGPNWCTPRQDQMDELLKAATDAGSEKVTCVYTQENYVYGFKFTGSTDGYTDNSVFFPAQDGDGYFGNACYWSASAGGSGAWYMQLSYGFGNWYSDWNSGGQGYYYLVRPVLRN